MLTPKFMIPARANGAALAAFRLPFLALLLSAPLALAAVAPIISGLRITALNDGFAANWITDTPASSVVFNSVNTSLASDPALVTRHMLVVRGFASCLSPAVQVYVQSVNSGGTAADNNGGWE